MKMNLLKTLRGGVFAVGAGLLLLAVSSCNVGLGESVDTEAPTLDIAYPPVSAVIRDSFVLFGTCSDDKSVSSVKVTVMNTATKEAVVSNVPATINSDDTWQIELNSFDESKYQYNGWQFADGTYQVSAVASDNAGHTSSAVSRTFDIDNTAPLFIISNPGVVKDGESSASAYGSVFTIEGTIADDHTVSSMDVTIYDKDGNIVSNETYGGEEITSFHEDDIATAGGTSVTIAQHGTGENLDSLGERYKELHGSDSGTEYYTCSIKLTDSAQAYKNPAASSARSAEELKADGTGNATYTVYLYNDVYASLMSAKKGMGLGASSLKDIVNGTSENEEAKTILEAAAKNTEGKSDGTNLYFSLNPQANPYYTVSGFTFGFNDETLQTASAGGNINVIVNAGLDGTLIDLDGSSSSKTTVKVWMKEYDARPAGSAAVLGEMKALAKEVSKQETLDLGDGEQSFVEYSKATAEKPVSSYDGWKLIYDYGQNNSGNSSVSTKSVNFTLPQGSVSLKKYYILCVTGADDDGVEFMQGQTVNMQTSTVEDAFYGFEGTEEGVPPTLKIASPVSGAYVKSSDELVFSGTASVSSGSLYVSGLTAVLTVTDQDTNKTFGPFTEKISRSSVDASFAGSSSLACDGNGNWTFTPKNLSGYTEIQAAENSKKSYAYTLELAGTSSSGHEATTSSYVQIDSTPPAASVSSISPTVDGSEYDNTENVYVNGAITVKGTVEETNLENVTMQIFVDGKAVPCFKDSDGNDTDTLNLGKTFSFTQTIDTAALEDGKSLDIRITATDRVGNSTAYSSLSASGSAYGKLVILQETDRPKISLGNSSNATDFVAGSSKISEANGNLFGTTTNNKLTATISDDDTITAVVVTVYDKDGKALDEKSVYDGYKANPYTVNPGKSSYSLTYYLPPAEGVYKICIDAYDYLLTDTNNAKESGHGTTGEYYIAVSAGAPTVTVDSYSQYQTESPTFSGKVSASAAEITATFMGADPSKPETYQKTLDSPVFTVTKTDGTWTGKLAEGANTLSDGKYSLHLTAKDAYGQSGTAEITFEVDKTPPVIDSIVPSATVKKTDKYINAANSVAVSGTVTEKNIASVTVYLLSSKDETPSQTSKQAAAVISGNAESASKSNYSATVTGVDDGSYYIAVAAKDLSGREKVTSVESRINYVVDTKAPEVSELAVSSESVNMASSKNDFTFTAKIADATSGIESAALYDGNKELGAMTAAADGTYTYTISKDALLKVLPTGSHALTVHAKDAAGNENSGVSRTVSSDATAPKVENVAVSPEVSVIEDNASKTCVNGKITVTGLASDETSLSGAELEIKVYKSDDTAKNDLSAAGLISEASDGSYTLGGVSKSWKFILDTTKLADNSSYTLELTAKDAAGNTSESESVVINVDQSTDAPGIEVTSSDTAYQTIASLEGKQANILSAGGKITATVTDDDGIDTVTVSYQAENAADKTQWTKSENLLADNAKGRTTANISYTLPPEVTEGGYLFKIDVKDTKGETSNATKSSQFAVAVDNSAPVIKITSPSDSGYYSNSISVEGTVSDASGKATVSAAYGSSTSTENGAETTKTATGSYSAAKDALPLGAAQAALTDTIDISSLADNTSDGYTATYTATDRWGRTSTASLKYYKDSTSPVFDDESSSVSGTATMAGVNARWFKDETLSVTSVFTESGSGVDQVYFWLDPSDTTAVARGDISKASASATASRTGDGKYQVKTSIGGFTESESGSGHTLYVVSYDKAGNKSAEQSYTIRIDATAPEFTSTKYTYDGENFADASGNVLSNKKKDITIYGTISDVASGVADFEKITVAGTDVKSSATVKFSTDTISTYSKDALSSIHFYEYGSDELKNAVSTETNGVAAYDYTKVKSWQIVIPAGSIKAGAVNVAPKDTAGNGGAQKLFTFDVDTDAPSVTFINPVVKSNKSSSTVNGTVSVTGKVEEQKTPKSLEFYYSTTKSDNIKDYKKLGGTITDASQIFSWAKEIDFNILSKAAEAKDSNGAYTGTASLYILAAATDMAENANYTDGSITKSDGFAEIPVDLNGDVPTVRMTNLTIKNSGYWLVSVERMAVEGTVSDDDGAIEEFNVFESPVVLDTAGNVTTTATGNLTWSKGSSDFTYQPADTKDGEKTLYFYIKDAAGTVFYTGKDTTKTFTEPLVQVKSETPVPSSNAFKYTSDGTAPAVSSIEAAYSDSESGTYTPYEPFTATTILGGTKKRYVKFQIVAADDNGVESGTITVGSKTADKLAFTGSKTYIAETNAYDLSTITESGPVTVAAVVRDSSGQTGNASAVFTLDNQGPQTFNVTSLEKGTILTSDVTLSGIANDGSGSGIMSVQFAVPTRAQKNAAAVSTDTSAVTNYSGVRFAGDMKDSATASLWSFVFSASSNRGQLTQYTSQYDESSDTAPAVSKNGYIYTIPFWFLLTDSLGNEAVYQYEVSYNPNANWPTAKIVTPQNGAILGTSADFAGSASDNNSVKAVYLQFDLDGDGDYDDEDLKLFISSNPSAKVYTMDGRTVESTQTTKIEINESGAIKQTDSEWWGVQLDGTTSWNGTYTLPSSPTEDESKSWYVRAAAVDNENICGLWSDGSEAKSAGASAAIAFRVDDNAPKIGSTELYVSNSNGNRSYSSDMYVSKSVSERWYLNVSLFDDDAGINIDGTTVTEKTGSGSTNKIEFEKTEAGSVTYEKNTYHQYTIKIPLNLEAEGTVTYTVSTKDNAKTPLSTSATYSFTVDNTAPTVNAVKFRDEELDMRKLYNTNREAEISSDVEDSISGFASLNFFFERGGKYYVPFAGGFEGSWSMEQASGVAAAETGLKLTDGIPGYTLEGTGNAKENTFVISSRSADISYIRKGGIIKIDGSYYNITGINGTTVTFDGILAKNVTSAIFPYALTVNYSTTQSESSSWSSGSYSIGNDDGDGLVETVTKSGAKWTCTASLLSDAIEDGTIVLHAVAIDNAGNVSKDLTTRTMIANNTPRLAKVYLANDLNGDGEYSDNEIEGFTALDENGKSQEIATLATDLYDFNSSVPNNTNGKSDNKKAYFKVTGDLVIGTEFVSGQAGQGNISYDAILKGSGTEQAPTWNEKEKLHGDLSESSPSITGAISAESGNTLRYLTLSKDALNSFNKEDNVATIALSLWDSSDVYQFEKVSATNLYKTSSKVEEGNASVVDSSDKTLYTSFGYQWTIANIPLYFDITDDVAPVGTITPFYWNGDSSDENMSGPGYNTSRNNSIVYYTDDKGKTTRIGHIDIAGTDGAPDVSGTIKIEGDISDDQLIGRVEVTVGSITAGATYDAAAATWGTDTNTVATNGYNLTISENSLTQTGHTAKWTLLLDTSKLTNGANEVSVTTTQAKPDSSSALTSTPGTTATKSGELTGYYPVRVVPYITSVERTGSNISAGSETSGNINRSKLGHYSVAEGETLTVYGWNFGTSATWAVGTNTGNSVSPEADATKQNLYSFTMTVPSVSGSLSVTSGTESVNNLNSDPVISGNVLTNGVAGKNGNNAESYSMRGNSTVYYASDDRYLEVWALGNFFKNTDGGVELQNPVMTADANGNLYASWAAQSNSNIMFSNGVNGVVFPVFRCYDQPSTYTGIGFDRKGSSGGASIAFIPEHQGYGGTFSFSGLSSSIIDGGMGAIQITSTDIAAKTAPYSGLDVRVDGNPGYEMDSNGNYTAYYNLANYDMNHRLGSYEKPKSAKHGNYMHTIWHDNVTDSLKYSVVDTSDTKYGTKESDGAAGGVAGWVVLDGGYTGQDRQFDWTSATDSSGNDYNSLSVGKTNHVWIGNGNDANNNKRLRTATYSDVLFIAPKTYQRLNSKTKEDKINEDDVYKKGPISKETKENNKSYTSITVSGSVVKLTSSFVPEVGDTIALMDLTTGSYQTSLRRLTGLPSKEKNETTYTLSGDFTWEGGVNHKIHAATIYHGDLNVVGDTTPFREDPDATVPGSSGSSADIDVDSEGKPVVAYFDDSSSTLRIAKATSENPKLASEWKRIKTSFSCSGSVSMRIDSNDNIHVMYKNENGQLCYLFGKINTAKTDYSFSDPEIVDETGSLDYGALSVIERNEGDSTTCIPCMTYMNSAGTAQAVKYAYRKSALPAEKDNSSSTALNDNWDYMIVPSLGNGHYAVSENQISLEARKAGWTGTEDNTLKNGGTSVTPATVQAAIAFKSKMFETAYLKTE